jgi:predicted molibdopterin-dependent oxidoreductase YjgC
LYAVDPRRTSSAQWADVWAGLDVGTDIALSNTMAREIIVAGLAHREFITNATSGFDAYKASVMPWTLERGAAATGVPAEVIREMAHAYATAPTAMICWTLGITEHHNAVDNVLSLINLALLTGHVGRWGSGINPLRGQNNVQGGGDMGALPDRLPGFQHVENDAVRAPFDRHWGVKVPPVRGWHLTGMFEAMGRGDLRALYVIGENPAQSEADQHHAEKLLRSLDVLVVQDVMHTATVDLADVALPAAAGAFESEGTVTSSERRVQRVRRTKPPLGDSRDDLTIIFDLARTMGADWGPASAERVWDEVRALSPVHRGMSYARLDAEGGLQWPCYDEAHPGEAFLHGRLWDRPIRGPRAPFHVVEHRLPFEGLDDEYPLRLTTGRRLEEYNTGVQTGGYASPVRRGETIDVSPEDAARLGLAEGQRVRVRSRRGAVVAPVHIDPALRPGLTFMTLHFPDEVATNHLTIDAVDPKSGTAEFKAAAVRLEAVEG